METNKTNKTRSITCPARWKNSQWCYFSNFSMTLENSIISKKNAGCSKLSYVSSRTLKLFSSVNSLKFWMSCLCIQLSAHSVLAPAKGVRFILNLENVCCSSRKVANALLSFNLYPAGIVSVTLPCIAAAPLREWLSLWWTDFPQQQKAIVSKVRTRHTSIYILQYINVFVSVHHYPCKISHNSIEASHVKYKAHNAVMAVFSEHASKVIHPLFCFYLQKACEVNISGVVCFHYF